VTAVPLDADAIVVGAGAAGLATAIFAARAKPGCRVVVLEGAKHVGAKILVSGGSRCNVTNRAVSERDFRGGSSRVVQRVLRAFPADRAAAFFESIGVPLHEEESGKLFPDSNSSRTVLDALLREAARCGVVLEAGQRVVDVRHASAPEAVHFEVQTGDGRVRRAAVVVLATGGRSLPKTGSDGFGYELARRLGHGCVPTTPALAPLVLVGGRHRTLAGIALPVELTLRMEGRALVTVSGPLLWTHFGISGPAALDLSRHWHRAVLDSTGPARASIDVRVNLCPGDTVDGVSAWLAEQARERPKAFVRTVLATRLPAAVADLCVADAGLPDDLTLAHLARDDRRRVAQVLVEGELDVQDSRGYPYAEVTAGGVPLDEVDHATMQSRVCAGLFLCGEILDVDGRLGGFNFQWAWSSAWVAGHGIARLLAEGRAR
jgi:predicted Rossmann fold flavoprotein